MSILETACRYVPQGVMESVTVSVGELSAVEPELLAYAWDALVADTPHSQCRLEIRWVAARQVCPACSQEWHRDPGQWLPNCELCGGPLSIEGGYEMDILEIAYREPEPACHGK